MFVFDCIVSCIYSTDRGYVYDILFVFSYFIFLSIFFYHVLMCHIYSVTPQMLSTTVS